MKRLFRSVEIAFGLICLMLLVISEYLFTGDDTKAKRITDMALRQYPKSQAVGGFIDPALAQPLVHEFHAGTEIILGCVPIRVDDDKAWWNSGNPQRITIGPIQMPATDYRSQIADEIATALKGCGYDA